MTVEYGNPLDIKTLNNFVNQYLMNTEPNVMINPQKNINIIENTNSI
jgi:hypothetical protein